MMVDELGRFWYWVQQGGNSNLVLIAVTICYVLLTHRIMKASVQQARALLQPALSVNVLLKGNQGSKSFITIKNIGNQSVVFLAVIVKCLPRMAVAIMHQKGWDDLVLPAGETTELEYDFRQELEQLGTSSDYCGYQVRLVVSDLSRQVVGEYEFLPVLGRLSYRTGFPLRVRLPYLVRKWKWAYYRFMQWAERMQETMGPTDL